MSQPAVASGPGPVFAESRVYYKFYYLEVSSSMKLICTRGQKTIKGGTDIEELSSNLSLLLMSVIKLLSLSLHNKIKLSQFCTVWA